jgi:hypothetical protein
MATGYAAVKEMVSQRPELVAADQRVGQMQQHGTDVGASLGVDRQPPVGCPAREQPTSWWRPRRWVDSTSCQAIE